MSDRESISFRTREFKGSRYRCLLLTHQPPETVSGFLSALVADHAEIPLDALWAPRGFLHPAETDLTGNDGFLTEDQQETMVNWWLEVRRSARLPQWDLVSTCLVDGRKGLILVEAKAHEGELSSDDRCGSAHEGNRRQIANALAESTEGLNAVCPGFDLALAPHYQLSNRFAFAWKLASLGIPVVLVYLGFLEAWEMEDGGRTLLTSLVRWRECLYNYARGTVPREAWEQRFTIKDVPLTVLSRAARVDGFCSMVQEGESP